MADLPRRPRSFPLAIAASVAALLAPGALAAAPLGENTTFPGLPNATALTSGPDGNMWFVELAGNRIGRMAPTDGALTTFTVPGDNVSLRDLTAGPDGNLWFADSGSNSVGRITPSGTVTLFPQPDIGGTTLGPISAGPDGNLWIGWQGMAGNWIQRLSPDGTSSALASLGAGWFVATLAPAAGGLYFTESTGVVMGFVTTDLVPDATLPGTVQGQAAAAAPDSSLWYSATPVPGSPPVQPAIRRWDPATRTQTDEFPLPASGGAIAWGTDGNLWVGLSGSAALRRLTPAGAALDTASALPSGLFQGITPGPDGSMWYVGSATDEIARTGTGMGAPTQVTIVESGGAFRCVTNALPTAMGAVTRAWTWSVDGRPVDGFSGSGIETAYAPPASDVGKSIECAVRDTYSPSLVQMGFRSGAIIIPAPGGGATPSTPGATAPARLRATWRVRGRKVTATFRPVARATGNRIVAAPAKGGALRTGRCTVKGRARARTVTCVITLPAGARRWRVTAQARRGATVVAQAQRVVATR